MTKTVIEIEGVTDTEETTATKAENNDVEMAIDEDSREFTSDSPADTQDKNTTPSVEVEKPAVEETASTRTFEENSSFFGNAGAVPMIMWPKDRVLLNRLDLIIQMFEANGEWPQKAAMYNNMTSGMNPSMMASLVSNNPAHAHLLAEQRKLMISPSIMDTNGQHTDMEMDGPYDQENSNSESDFLSAMQQHQANLNGGGVSKSGGKPKRGRPPKFEPNLTATPEQSGSKRHSMFGNVDSRDGYSSNDDDNEPGEIKPNKSKLSAKSNEPTVSKRGRKSTNFSHSQAQRSPPSSAARQPEISAQDAATAAALAAMFLAPGQDPEERITVVNVENGQRLTGSKAPRRADLPLWLISHPNYLPDESEIINLAIKQGQMNNPEFQQQRSSKQTRDEKPTSKNLNENDEDSISPKSASRNHKQMEKRPLANNNRPMSPATSQPNNTLLATQVILFNKKSGKKLPPQNLPTWKSLCGFLDRNQQVFIDPKSNDLIRQKFGSNGNVPSIIKSRQVNVNPSVNGSGGRTSNGNGSDQRQQQQTNKTHIASRNSESPPSRTSQNARNAETTHRKSSFFTYFVRLQE